MFLHINFIVKSRLHGREGEPNTTLLKIVQHHLKFGKIEDLKGECQIIKCLFLITLQTLGKSCLLIQRIKKSINNLLKNWLLLIFELLEH